MTNASFFKSKEDSAEMIGLVWFYGISTIVGYLMPYPFYTYIMHIKDVIGLGLWHINHYRLFNAKSSLDIYIIYI